MATEKLSGTGQQRTRGPLATSRAVQSSPSSDGDSDDDDHYEEKKPGKGSSQRSNRPSRPAKDSNKKRRVQKCERKRKIEESQSESDQEEVTEKHDAGENEGDDEEIASLPDETSGTRSSKRLKTDKKWLRRSTRGATHIRYDETEISEEAYLNDEDEEVAPAKRTEKRAPKIGKGANSTDKEIARLKSAQVQAEAQGAASDAAAPDIAIEQAEAEQGGEEPANLTEAKASEAARRQQHPEADDVGEATVKDRSRRASSEVRDQNASTAATTTKAREGMGTEGLDELYTDDDAEEVENAEVTLQEEQSNHDPSSAKSGEAHLQTIIVTDKTTIAQQQTQLKEPQTVRKNCQKARKAATATPAAPIAGIQKETLTQPQNRAPAPTIDYIHPAQHLELEHQLTALQNQYTTLWNHSITTWNQSIALQNQNIALQNQNTALQNGNNYLRHQYALLHATHFNAQRAAAAPAIQIVAGQGNNLAHAPVPPQSSFIDLTGVDD